MVCLFIELVCLLHTLWFKLHILIEVKVFRSSVFRGSMSNDSMKPSSITPCQSPLSSSRKGWIWDSSNTPLRPSQKTLQTTLRLVGSNTVSSIRNKIFAFRGNCTSFYGVKPLACRASNCSTPELSRRRNNLLLKRTVNGNDSILPLMLP